MWIIGLLKNSVEWFECCCASGSGHTNVGPLKGTLGVGVGGRIARAFHRWPSAIERSFDTGRKRSRGY